MLQQLPGVLSRAGMVLVTQLDLSNHALGSSSGLLTGSLARAGWHFFFFANVYIWSVKITQQ